MPANMNPKKAPMPERDAAARRRCFDEVATGYSAETAVEEARRCLVCKNPRCVGGCPVGIDIPGFLEKVAGGDFAGAYDVIARSNALPGISGRVCPQERQCEAVCVRGVKGEPVGIGRIERFVADWHMERGGETAAPAGRGEIAVAVVGSGPAGLTCAAQLAGYGYAVTLFEAFHTPGGVLVYGIPEFRLPKRVVRREVDGLKKLGVTICTNYVVGKTCTVDDLFDDGFRAVFLGTGAGLPKFMGIPGETLVGVFSANEYLTRVNLMRAGQAGFDTPVEPCRRVAVIGGGNVAMDAARCAVRMGAEEVSIVYRRSEAELPARAEELHHAKEEGVVLRLLTNPVRILGDEQGRVRGMECLRMELGEPDERGRRSPHPIPGSEFELEADAVIMALGTSPNPLVTSSAPDLGTDRHGCLTVDDDAMTTRPGVFAGGDAVTGAATVIQAMGAGKHAAERIHAYLQAKE